VSFHHPFVLLLLVLPVSYGFWLWVRRGHPLTVPFDHTKVSDGKWLRRCAVTAEMLVAAMLAVAVLILAQPRKPALPTNARVLNNIVFCLDVSGSMGTPVAPGVSRFDAAMTAINSFCNYRKGDSFGLTIFGGEYLHWLPPTKELSAIQFAAPFLKPGKLPYWFGGTMIAKALDGCLQRLEQTTEGDRAIILVTDGGSADFANGRDREIGQKLAAAKIRVYAVLIAKDQGSQGVYVISSLTNGRVFDAADPATLSFVFHEIDQMQKARFKPVVADWVDFDKPFAIAGLVLLGFFGMAQFGLRFTPW
jgi:Ca-activated chloride channel family protein